MHISCGCLSIIIRVLFYFGRSTIMVKEMTPENKKIVQHGYEVIETGDSRTAHIEVEIQGYTSGEINVRPQEETILVLDSIGNELRRFILPESVDPFAVEAVLKNGILSIDAPLTCKYV